MSEIIQDSWWNLNDCAAGKAGCSLLTPVGYRSVSRRCQVNGGVQIMTTLRHFTNCAHYPVSQLVKHQLRWKMKETSLPRPNLNPATASCSLRLIRFACMATSM